MDPVIVKELVERIFDLLAEKLGAKGKTLHQRLLYVQRQLPGRVKRAGQALVDAQALADHPRLAMQIDSDAFNGSFDVISQHLSEIDAAAERSRKRYNFWAVVAGQVLFGAVLIAALLMWRGYI